jgi:predicted permease
MIRNYFKIAIRNLLRNKSYAFINVLGLAVGISACLLIFLIIQNELSFDTFHAKRNAVYRVVTTFKGGDGSRHSPGVPFPVAEALRIDYPALKEIAAIYGNSNELITVLNAENEPVKKFEEEEGVFFTEPQFFRILDFPWIAGHPSSALSDPNTAVLTKFTAEKYFGNWRNAIGKTIKYNNKALIKITGIMENPPANTDFPFKMIISFQTLKKLNPGRFNDWVSTYSQSYCFVLFPEGLTKSVFNSFLEGFTRKHKPPEYAGDQLSVQPLSDMHFDNRYGNYRNRTFTKGLITALTLIGVFLLVIACVNFINLATAQAVNRSKEVGVRKVLGSNRRQLAIQFISETALITIFSLLAAVAIGFIALPFMNQLLETEVTFNIIHNPPFITFLFLLVIIVTMLSGFYPAIVLSRFSVITALKTKMTTKYRGGVSLRKTLVILQFTIAHVLIIATLIVVNQMDYFMNASLGFDKDLVMNVSIPSDSISELKMDFVRNQLKQNDDLENVSFSFASPSHGGNWESDFKFDHSPKNTDFSANLKWADVDYFETYNLKFIAGRPYFESDTVRELVVNETLLKKLGIRNPDDAIGKELNFWNGEKVAPIVGVIKDFHSNSLRDPISPVVLGTWKGAYQTINIKVKPARLAESLAFVEKVWTSAYPDHVYKYRFLDDKVADFYKQEKQLSQLYKLFAAIAIFISCLGLYGLVSFMAVQRTKEVGIRKVLGATAARIVYLFSKEFTILITIAFVIAAPIAWLFMHNWLQDFAFRVNPGIGVFLIAIAGSILIAWVSVGYRAIRAASVNPVDSLRTE